MRREGRRGGRSKQKRRGREESKNSEGETQVNLEIAFCKSLFPRSF